MRNGYLKISFIFRIFFSREYNSQLIPFSQLYFAIEKLHNQAFLSSYFEDLVFVFGMLHIHYDMCQNGFLFQSYLGFVRLFKSLNWFHHFWKIFTIISTNIASASFSLCSPFRLLYLDLSHHLVSLHLSFIFFMSFYFI